MLIDSDFHDYYDSIARQGVDKTCPFIRKRTQHKLEKVGDRYGRSHTPFPPGGKHYPGRYSYDAHYVVIGFCGKYFPLVIVTKRNGLTPWEEVETKFFYTAESFVEYFDLEQVPYKQYDWNWSEQLDLEHKGGIERFFNVDTWKPYDSYFIQYKTPTFLLERTPHLPHLTVNPRLQDYKFQQIKDPYSAFQDLHMYISGVLGVDSRPTVTVSDEVKAASKGHDGKYSFKKPPGKGRWR